MSSTKPRVLLVSDFYPPVIGGAARSAQLLARELSNRGYETTVATSWQPGTATLEREDQGFDVHRLHGLTMRLPRLSANPYHRIPPPFPDPELVWRLRKLIRRTRPDIVHCSGWLSYSCAVALLGSGVPLVLAGRDYGSVCPVGFLVRPDGAVCDGPEPTKCLACAANYYGTAKGTLAVAGVLGGRPLLRSKVRGVQSVSAHLQGVLQRHLFGANGRRSREGELVEMVIPDFRGESDGSPDEHVLARLPQEPFILFVGALRQIKGIGILLAAYECLAAPPPLVVFGSHAPDMPTRFPRGVTVEYDVSHATVMAAWDRALFGVAPSVLPEPLGNVVHEAMSRGKPVIGTAPSGHEEMIDDGVNGLLVGCGDLDGLVEAMARLIKDEGLRERLGEAARVHSERFTAGAQLPNFDALFERALASAGRG